MKIAIHQSKIFNHSTGWEKQWISYCEQNNLDFEIIDCYDLNILDRVKQFDILLWHFQNYVLQDMQFARNILLSIEKCGVKTFPNNNTAWHYDDKVAQMFLLKSINAPIPKNWFFVDKETAQKWLTNKAELPVVAKLTRGSGSHNVKLIFSVNNGLSYVKKMFGRGVSASPKLLFKVTSNFKSAKNWSTIIKRIKRIPDFIQSYTKGGRLPREKDYCSFQEFIPNNGFDLKVYVIGDKVSFISRNVRKNDFRASGGGAIVYDKKRINNEILKSAFKTYDCLGFQCMGFDYVIDKKTNEGKIIEMCFGFNHEALLEMKGYWDRNLIWHNKPLNAPQEVLKNLMK
jgi:glutathione synthase/RimK-type ligase-like ATP-grasp enzyme